MLARRYTSEMSPLKNSSALQSDSSEDDSGPVQRVKKHVQRFSDSDTGNEDGKINRNTVLNNVSSKNSDSEIESSNCIPYKSGAKTRIQMGGSASSSDSNEAVKNVEQQMRMKNKRKKINDKFKGLLSSRGKLSSEFNIENKQSSEDSSEHSDDEMSSISKIKQKIKKSMASMSSVVDPDTSEDESHVTEKQTQKYKQRKAPKSAKMTEPKPIRMSAKQAMENMQLIKSESNRMLREKAVSLPYHRPKALALKDIMARRKPAVSADGKALPIKMNEEQLKQYAHLLEQRQKEMMELCKSESDEESAKDEEKTEETPKTTQIIFEESSETKDKNNETDCNKDKMTAINNNVAEINEKLDGPNKCMEIETIDTNANDVNINNEFIQDDSVKVPSTETECLYNDGDNSKMSELLSTCNPEKNYKNDSNTDLKLVYDTVEDDRLDHTHKDAEENVENNVPENNYHLDNNSVQKCVDQVNSEVESQLISLHYTENNTEESEKADGNQNENFDKIGNDDIDDNQDDKIGTDVINDKQDDDIGTDDINDKQDDKIGADDINDKQDDKIGTDDINVTQDDKIGTDDINDKQDDKIGTNDINDKQDDKIGTDDINDKQDDKIGTDNINDNHDDFFSDDDVNMEDIDKIIENAEIMKDENINSPMLIRDPQGLNVKPKLIGAPGMIIDLDGGSIGTKKRSGVELLKERFTYFAKLKTPEEMERGREKTLKPGAQHLKLKHQLEEKIAEQRSLEWAKRLEEVKQRHLEMETILDDAEDSYEKLEKEENELEDEDNKKEESNSESEEEELEENDIEIKDKPRKHNPMVDDEAEESDCDENDVIPEPADDDDPCEDNNDNIEEDDEYESSDDESSESEEETAKPKKGRILKAFEDSDDEDAKIKSSETEITGNDEDAKFKNTESERTDKCSSESDKEDVAVSSNEIPGPSQDDVIQLAQRHQSVSDDLFTSQESSTINAINKDGNNASDEVLVTQTFSILDSTSGFNIDNELKSPTKLDALCMSQPYQDPNINAIVNGSQLPITQSSQSQPLGEDILALCTGKFYENEFVTQTNTNQYVADIPEINDDLSNKPCNDVEPTNCDINMEGHIAPPKEDIISLLDKENKVLEECKKIDENSKKSSVDGNLKFILDELDDPEFDKPKINKFFTGGKTQEGTNQISETSQIKKRFIIDSEDESNETNLEAEGRKKKKLKKKKPEKRALQISDDEEEEEEFEQDVDDYISDCEEDPERLVEYDSEENEIEVKIDKPKKKRKVADFFEQEAELTSEDEWVGSGDEDEKGLDRMEREEGDDEVFHQGKLRRELGQIHMRDVLDQDKREVRLIQELLFEDGDLGDGHRQRKFRWRNAGEGDEDGAVVDEFADTQEEEFESEEQWRKQRHEREVYLRQMQQNEEESLNVSVNRTTIIKANLSSKSMSTLLQEVNQSKADKTDSPVVQEKKTAKDIPSPKKSFSIFQQNYHGSLLTRGRGALARLAALATPLTADDDAPKIGSLAPHKRNFVFTALSQDNETKVTIKRKADVDLGTPKLVKKMRIEDKQTRPNSSLLDHLKL